jgi:acetyltransferase-like isoleucine patch superfamily enzyme
MVTGSEIGHAQKLYDQFTVIYEVLCKPKVSNPLWLFGTAMGRKNSIFLMHIFRFIHRTFCQMRCTWGDGFLGQLPTDFRSKLFTIWLRLSGAQIGANSVVHHRVAVWEPKNIMIGDNVLIPSSTDMAGMAKIQIGHSAFIGAGVSFVTNYHPLDDPNLNADQISAGLQNPILVGNHCWLMNRVTIISGQKQVSIGDCSWIAAGAVVTHDVPPNEIWGGVPARLIRRLPEKRIKAPST